MNLLTVIFHSQSVPFVIIRLSLLYLSFEVFRWFYTFFRYRKMQRDINRITSDDELR